MGALDRRRLLLMRKKNSIFNTILYADGTLVIYEDPAHHDANVAAHGAVSKTYAKFKGDTASPPWSTTAEKESLVHVIVDSEFKPTNMSS